MRADRTRPKGQPTVRDVLWRLQREIIARAQRGQPDGLNAMERAVYHMAVGAALATARERGR